VAKDTSSGDPETVQTGTDVRTFLFADVRGYTRFTHDAGDEAASALAGEFADIVREAVPGFEGELLELRGDEALCVFRSARQGLRAAVELQRRLRTPTEQRPAFPLGVGIGLDAGEAVPTQGGYRGAALNVAARLCSVASGGEILATERLVGLAGSVPGIHWGAPRNVALKGMPRPEKVVLVTPDQPLPPVPTPPIAPAPTSARRRLTAVAVLVALALAATAVIVRAQGGGSAPVVATPKSSLAVIDPAKGRVVADVPLSATPESIVAGGGQVWVGTQGDSVTPVSVRKERAGSPIGLCCDPATLAYGQAAVWAYDGWSRLTEIDAAGRSVVSSHALWRCPLGHNVLHPCGGSGVVVVRNQVWVGRSLSGFPDVLSGELVRVDATNLHVLGTIRNVVVGVLAATSSEVWAFGNNAVEADAVSIHDLRTFYHQPLPMEMTGANASIAVGFGYVWVASPLKSLYRLTSYNSTTQMDSDTGITALATSQEGVWQARSNGTVTLLDQSNGHPIATYRFHNAEPVALAVSGGRVWVALA
jgi:class 3 adenylate cyclase